MSQQNKTIRWGIIELGNIASKFAEGLLTIKGSKLQVIASRTQ